MYFSSLFVLAYGRLYLLNDVQYLIVTSANKIKIKNPKNIKNLRNHKTYKHKCKVIRKTYTNFSKGQTDGQVNRRTYRWTNGHRTIAMTALVHSVAQL